MRQYLLSVYQPDGDPLPPEQLAPIAHNLELLTEEMKTAGVWVFSAGLHPAGTATVLRIEDGEVVMTDGPYAEGKEHLGGFTVIRTPDPDSALAWGAKLTRAIGLLPIEVRPFQE